AHRPLPRLGQRKVDPPRPPRDQHELEVCELRIPPRITEHQHARQLHLPRELPPDGDPRLEPRLELRRLLEEAEHRHPSSSRSTPSARQRVISSRQRRNTSSSCIDGSAMSPASPASSRTVSTGFPAASGNAASMRRCSSVITRIVSALASR